jgi:DME family drug/metabolite transporter
MAALFLRERQGLRWALSTALAVTGCVLLAGIGAQTASAAVDPMGVLLALGAGASYAIYTLASTRIVTAVPPDLAAAATFGLGALFLLPIFLVSDGSWLLTPRGVAAALALGLVATAAAYIMYTRALRTVKASTAVTLALGEPLVATLLGVFLLGERLDVRGLVGLLLITAALLALTLRSTAPMQRAVERNNASTH